MSLVRYPKVIPYTKFEPFGVIRFLVMLRTNRQTNRSDSKILPTPTDIVGVGRIKRLNEQLHVTNKLYEYMIRHCHI